MDENRSFDLNPAVSQQHAALKFKPIGLDSLFNCLNLEILHCLSIQPEDRPSSSLLADRLNRLSDELRAEPNIQEQLTRYHMKDDPPV